MPIIKKVKDIKPKLLISMCISVFRYGKSINKNSQSRTKFEEFLTSSHFQVTLIILHSRESHVSLTIVVHSQIVFVKVLLWKRRPVPGRDWKASQQIPCIWYPVVSDTSVFQDRCPGKLFIYISHSNMRQHLYLCHAHYVIW